MPLKQIISFLLLLLAYIAIAARRDYVILPLLLAYAAGCFNQSHIDNRNAKRTS